MRASANIFFDRPDTFFGVCEAIGADLGFHPNWLRVAFGVGVLFQPLAVVVTYAVLGVIVLASRLIHPAPKQVQQPVPVIGATPVAVAPVRAPASVDEPEYALAA